MAVDRVRVPCNGSTVARLHSQACAVEAAAAAAPPERVSAAAAEEEVSWPVTCQVLLVHLRGSAQAKWKL